MPRAGAWVKASVPASKCKVATLAASLPSALPQTWMAFVAEILFCLKPKSKWFREPHLSIDLIAVGDLDFFAFHLPGTAMLSATYRQVDKHLKRPTFEGQGGREAPCAKSLGDQ